MRVKVRLFARLRDIVGVGDLDQELTSPATIADAWARLVAAHPQLQEYTSSLSCARNEDYARWDAPLQDGDEVAFLPPVSGGAHGSPRRFSGPTTGGGDRADQERDLCPNY